MGTAYLLEYEILVLARGTREEIPVIKQCGDDPVDLYGDILNARQIEFGHRARKQPFLIYHDHPLVGEHPYIKKKIGKDDE